MGRLYRALRDFEWIQSLIASSLGGGSIVAIEAFWDSIPLLWKGVVYGTLMFGCDGMVQAAPSRNACAVAGWNQDPAKVQS